MIKTSRIHRLLLLTFIMAAALGIGYGPTYAQDQLPATPQTPTGVTSRTNQSLITPTNPAAIPGPQTESAPAGIPGSQSQSSLGIPSGATNVLTHPPLPGGATIPPSSAPGENAVPGIPTVQNSTEPTNTELFEQGVGGAQNNAARNHIQTVLINFNNVNIIEFIRFVSKISNKNFVFDENDLQFNVTIVSEEPTTVENVMAALLQELRIHGLAMFERGNNVIIHKNPQVNAISRVVAGDTKPESVDSEIITQVFRVNIIDPDKVAAILKPLTSEKAIVEVFKDTNNIIVTDIITNVQQIAELLKALDSPTNGLVIGQYVVRQGYLDALVQLAQKIMQPISQDQPLIFVPHRAANSIFLVSTPFLIERTMAILQYLDQTQGLTRIFDLKDLQFHPENEGLRSDQWQLDDHGNWVFRPSQQAGVPGGNQPPEGYWYVDADGNWHFRLGTPPSTPGGVRGVAGPEGQWILNPQGVWVFQLAAGKSISPERLVRPERSTVELPAGHIERTQFTTYKLKYRKGDDVQSALGLIGQSLSQTGTVNTDLVQAIESAQWIESSNMLIFTGTAEALDKVLELVKEIDAPLRQVFIEMLILDTTVDNALNFGVDFGTNFGGGNTAGSESFLSTGSPLPIALASSGVGLTPDASSLSARPGFNLGIIGQRITHCGTQFATIGALVTAIHTLQDVKIVMMPKILTEDNNPAEVFVGINTPFPTQAIANDRGNIITQNFEYRDVGVRLRVTPQIADNNIVTITLYEEVSSIASQVTNTQPTQGGPTTNQSTTTTKVHLPDGFFLVISGILQDQDSRITNSVPCLGGVPFIGAAFKNVAHDDTKRNFMIFLRPKIIDTQEEIDSITKHQQDVFNYKNRYRTSWRYEEDEALRFFNLPRCDECCDDQDDDECYCSFPMIR